MREAIIEFNTTVTNKKQIYSLKKDVQTIRLNNLLLKEHCLSGLWQSIGYICLWE